MNLLLSLQDIAQAVLAVKVYHAMMDKECVSKKDAVTEASAADQCVP
jgi:hypothetical protein